MRQVRGTPVAKQRISFAGKLLENWLRLRDYKVEDNATLHLVLDLRGGMHHDSSGKIYVVAASWRRRTLCCKAFSVAEGGWPVWGVASVAGVVKLFDGSAPGSAIDLLMRFADEFVCCCRQAPSYRLFVTAQASTSSLSEESTPRSRAGRAASSAWCL